MSESRKTPGPAPKATGIGKRPLSLLWAVPAHAADIARLHGAIFPEPWDAAAIAGLLSHPGCIGLVASPGNPSEIMGFALARIAADEVEILTLGVVEPWRRRGIGRELVAGVKRAAVRGGAQALFLEVAQSNGAAQALYAGLGFVEVGRRSGYYQLPGGRAEDAIVLRATLGADVGG